MSEGAKHLAVVVALLVLVVAGILLFGAQLPTWAFLCWCLAIMLVAYLFGPALRAALDVTLGRLAESLRSVAKAIREAAKPILQWIREFVTSNHITASNVDDVLKGAALTALVVGIDWFLTHSTVEAILVDAAALEETVAFWLSQVPALMCVVLAYAAGDLVFVEAKGAEVTSDTSGRTQGRLRLVVAGLCLLGIVCLVQASLGWWRATHVEERNAIVQFLLWGMVPVALSVVLALYAHRLHQGLVLALAAVAYVPILVMYSVSWVLDLFAALVTAVHQMLLAIHTVLEALPRYALSRFGIVP